VNYLITGELLRAHVSRGRPGPAVHWNPVTLIFADSRLLNCSDVRGPKETTDSALNHQQNQGLPLIDHQLVGCILARVLFFIGPEKIKSSQQI
jgi:hypothetical protein